MTRRRRIGSALAGAILAWGALGACSSPDAADSLPSEVWVRRAAIARIGPLQKIDARLAPAGDIAELRLPTLSVDAPSGMVNTGGGSSRNPTAGEAARDAALTVNEPALESFYVTARDGGSVPLRMGPTRSTVDEIRYGLTGRTSDIEGQTWWEFRRLPR